MSDFEKGLMLAGFISPLNSEEYAEREAVQTIEDNNSNKKSKTFFKRSVLAAEIASHLHHEKTFGRVKFQKMIYLCECVGGMGLQDNYKKFAAGPFDTKFMHSIVPEFKRQQWFKVEVKNENGYSKTVYSPLSNAGGHKKYFDNYFSEDILKINRVINLFRKSQTRKVELVATLFHCVTELKTRNLDLSEKNIFKSFYSWSKEKSKYTEEEIRQELSWMQDNDIYPVNK